MSVKCAHCGTELADDVTFCTECGAKVEKPAPAPAAPVKTVYTEEPVGFFPYFGLMALFALPMVGFICSIIFSFAPKKKSLKNFARAQLVWTLIGAVASIVLVIIAVALGAALGNIFDSLEGGLPDVEDLLNSIKDNLPLE